LEANPDKINWFWLSLNKNAIPILETNPDKIEIDWSYLSMNASEGAICLLNANPDKINWDNLSENPNALHLLEENLDKINWTILCLNTGVFENPFDQYNYVLK